MNTKLLLLTIPLLFVFIVCEDSDKETNWVEECRPKQEAMLDAQSVFTDIIQNPSRPSSPIGSIGQQECQMFADDWAYAIDEYANCINQSSDSNIKDSAYELKQIAKGLRLDNDDICSSFPYDSLWTGKIYLDYNSQNKVALHK